MGALTRPAAPWIAGIVIGIVAVLAGTVGGVQPPEAYGFWGAAVCLTLLAYPYVFLPVRASCNSIATHGLRNAVAGWQLMTRPIGARFWAHWLAERSARWPEPADFVIPTGWRCFCCRCWRSGSFGRHAG